MALVTKFDKLGSGKRGQVHGEVACTFATFDVDGRRYLQLDTYGSSSSRPRVVVRPVPRRHRPLRRSSVVAVRTMLSRFQRSLADLQVRHIRTQIDTPWTNGKVEAFWATLQAEVLNRQDLADLADLAAAERAVTAYAGYYNYHRLHGEFDWHTPAERFDGTPFTDRGFENIPALTGVSQLLSELLAAA